MDSELNIPFSEIGNHVDKQTKYNCLVMENDFVVIKAPFQAIYGEVKPNGLEVFSTSKNEGKGSFSIYPVSISKGIIKDISLGKVSIQENTVILDRNDIKERFTTSTDGIQQDFIIPKKPIGNEKLRLELALKGAKVENESIGVKITMDSGRKMVYHRLIIWDSTGKEMEGTLSSIDEDKIEIVVDDSNAIYPLTIDPTITDANWIVVNPGISGANNQVRSILSVGTDIYFGGVFTAMGSTLANRIVKWNGSSWSSLGDGVNNTVNPLTTVHALTVIGTDLYVGGDFTLAGGGSANSIAKWDTINNTWSALGTGLGPSGTVVYTIVSVGTDLYVGGFFTTAGGNTVSRIAKWDTINNTWSSLGSGLNNTVRSIVSVGTDLYVGGTFTTAGGGSANRIAKWNGSSWSSLGSGLGSTVNTIVSVDSDLYVGGQFTTAGGGSANRIAKWDGSSWSTLGSGLGVFVTTIVRSIVLVGTDLYVGGDFFTAGDKFSPYLAKVKTILDDIRRIFIIS